MVEVTLIQGKLSPDLKNFEAETETPVLFDDLSEAIAFTTKFIKHAKPVRIISSYYDIESGTRVEYNTVRLYKAELTNISDEVREIIAELKESPAE